MTTLLLLLAFPLVWPFVAKAIWHSTINWLEMGINIFAVCILVTMVYNFGTMGKAWDHEVWNGEVTEKFSQKVSCDHSYACNCRMRESCTGTGKDRSCYSYQECDTCYEHSYDVDWVVKSNIGRFLINRINRQGTKEPPRWTAVRIGDPVSDTHSFHNYIKAVPESLFHLNSSLKEKYKDVLPPYPYNIYDYYNLDRVIQIGIELPDHKSWNRALSESLKTLGPTKQANAVVVITDIADHEFGDAIENHWLGGKKNDTVLIIGAPEFPNISWVKVFSWSKNEMNNIELRDRILGLKTVTRDGVIGTLDHVIRSHFERRSMEEYKYLEDEVEPSEWVIWICIFIAIFGSLGLSYFFHREEIRA